MGRVRAGKAAACAVLSVVTLLLAHPVQAAPNDMEASGGCRGRNRCLSPEGAACRPSPRKGGRGSRPIARRPPEGISGSTRFVRAVRRPVSRG